MSCTADMLPGRFRLRLAESCWNSRIPGARFLAPLHGLSACLPGSSARRAPTPPPPRAAPEAPLSRSPGRASSPLERLDPLQPGQHTPGLVHRSIGRHAGTSRGRAGFALARDEKYPAAGAAQPEQRLVEGGDQPVAVLVQDVSTKVAPEHLGLRPDARSRRARAREGRRRAASRSRARDSPTSTAARIAAAQSPSAPPSRAASASRSRSERSGSASNSESSQRSSASPSSVSCSARRAVPSTSPASFPRHGSSRVGSPARLGRRDPEQRPGSERMRVEPLEDERPGCHCRPRGEPERCDRVGELAGASGGLLPAGHSAREEHVRSGVCRTPDGSSSRASGHRRRSRRRRSTRIPRASSIVTPTERPTSGAARRYSRFGPNSERSSSP